MSAAKRVARANGCLCFNCLCDLNALGDDRKWVEICPECGFKYQNLTVPEVWVGTYYLPRMKPKPSAA